MVIGWEQERDYEIHLFVIEDQFASLSCEDAMGAGEPIRARTVTFHVVNSYPETTLNGCRHDSEGRWAPGMSATKCEGVKWNAANGTTVAANPVCWSNDVAWDSGKNPWVVGATEDWNNEGYDCRTKCAQGEDLHWCAKNGWWNSTAAGTRQCTWGRRAAINSFEELNEIKHGWVGWCEGW
jgi:hypothetical protein